MSFDHHNNDDRGEGHWMFRQCCRQVRAADLEEFDLILVMDRKNRQDLADFAGSAADPNRVRLFCDFVRDRPETEVPDPYYGGPDGFETVLDLVENGCEGILREIKSR